MLELYQEILTSILERENCVITFPQLPQTPGELTEGCCYKTLEKIKAVIADDSLDDAACFQRIEKIVCLLETIGVNTGNRHDFG